MKPNAEFEQTSAVQWVGRWAGIFLIQLAVAAFLQKGLFGLAGTGPYFSRLLGFISGDWIIALAIAFSGVLISSTLLIIWRQIALKNLDKEIEDASGAITEGERVAARIRLFKTHAEQEKSVG